MSAMAFNLSVMGLFRLKEWMITLVSSRHLLPVIGMDLFATFFYDLFQFTGFFIT